MSMRWHRIYPKKEEFYIRSEFQKGPTYFVQAEGIHIALGIVASLDDRKLQYAGSEETLPRIMENEHNNCPICVIYHMAGGAVVPMWQNT
jgi:hypothetical protein